MRVEQHYNSLAICLQNFESLTSKRILYFSFTKNYEEYLQQNDKRAIALILVNTVLLGISMDVHKLASFLTYETVFVLF